MMLRLCLGVSLWVVVMPGLRAQEFRFTLDTPDEIHLWQLIDLEVVLTSSGIPEGEPGTAAWQISVAHENLEIVSVKTSDQVLEDFWLEGFELTEITSGPSNEGFTSVVALSLQDPISLPPEGSVVVAEARYRVTEASCPSGGLIQMRDGLVGSGSPIDNRVSWQGQSVVPALGERRFAACRLNRYRLALDSAENPLVTHAGEGGRFSAHVIFRQEVATAISWSLAVAHEPDDVALRNIALSETVHEHLAGDGFALLELTQGEGNTGFVAQIELSNTEVRVLPGLEQALVVAEYEVVDFPAPGTQYQTTLWFTGSLRGSGGILSNGVSPEGVLEIGSPLVLSVQGGTPFIRGDANGDGLMDIADAVTGLSFLFLGGVMPCEEGADSNADSRLDISDPIYTLSYLFLGGPPPRAPFPDCARSPGNCLRSACAN